MPEFSFTGTSKVTMRHEKGMTTSAHVATDFRLDISSNLSRSQYLTTDDLPTKDGIKPLTQTFIQGLIGSIHFAHEKGWWDSAEHLRYIIEELQRGFIEVPDLAKGTM